MNAFQNTKKALAEAALLTHPQQEALLTHPQQEAPTSLTTDASDQAVGAILQQFVDGDWLPLTFFSKKIRPQEKKCSTFDHKLLALYLGVRNFCYFLEG